MIKWTSSTSSVMGGGVEVFLTPTDVARRLGVCRGTVYALIASGQLRSVRIGPRLVRVRESMLNAFLRDSESASEEREQALEAAEAIKLAMEAQ